MRKTLVVSIFVLTLLLCLVVGVELYIFLPRTIGEQAPAPTFAQTELAKLPTQVLIPTLSATSTPEPSNSTLDYLLSLDVPRNNPIELVPRLKKITGADSTPPPPTSYKTGDQASFWVMRDITGTYVLISATLKYVTPHSYEWVENGESVNNGDIKAAGDTFENKIYPTDRQYLDGGPLPELDRDPHVYILNTHFSGAIGYFSSADQYPRSVNRYSNGHELVYLDVHTLRPGTESYAGTLAHEFAHLLHWNENKREGSWVTEGFGDLAIKLNGYPVGHANSFEENPDLQLNAWATTPSEAIPHYGAAYLFLDYALSRFGQNILHDMIASGTHDIQTVQKALDREAPGLKFDDVFRDWVAANFIEDTSLGPRYSYPKEGIRIRPNQIVSQFPSSGGGTVHQYGTEYIQFETNGHELNVNFDGSQSVNVIPTSPHSGKMMWWGNRVDQSDTTLTHSFDLSGVSKASLRFWTWYDMESDFDYGYVEVSTDGGKTFDTLSGNYTTTSNPNDANYGNGYTCKSGTGCGGGSPPAQWVQEKIDLSRYTGKKILLRFEYITDAIYAAPGFAIDDIQIPELGFSDDAEKSGNGWIADGFARIDNTLPQRFIVQAIESGSGTTVRQVSIDERYHGSYSTAGRGKDLSRVVLVISGDTPVTWETGSFKYGAQ